MKVLYENEISLSPLQAKNLAIIGYGNHGRPQALNLKDSGLTLKIGLRHNSPHRLQAQQDGFEVLPLEEAAAWGDTLMLILPDEQIGAIYQAALAPFLKPGSALGLCHGLSIYAGWLEPTENINVFLAAPKAPGYGIRERYLQGSGVPGFYAVHRDPSGDTEKIALAYLKGVGSGRVGVFKTTIADETVCDLFSEQAVLCGGLSNLITLAFETLVEKGFSPEMAYYRCLYEIRLMGQLFQERGVTGMREVISSTARYGDLTRGARIVDTHVKENMRVVLEEITSGQFARQMCAEFAAGQPNIRQEMAKSYHHPLDETHRAFKAALHDALL